MSPHGRVWLTFDRNLNSSWHELSTVLDIPPHIRNRFRAGHEAGEIRDWLVARGRLGDLPEALRAIDRDDLATVVTPAVADRTLDTAAPVAQVAAPAPRTVGRRPAPLTAALAAVVIMAGTVLTSQALADGDPTTPPAPSVRWCVDRDVDLWATFPDDIRESVRTYVTWRIINISDNACTIVGQRTVELSLESAIGVYVWRSSGCDAAARATIVLLTPSRSHEPGESDYTRSFAYQEQGCRADIATGDYDMYVAFGSKRSGPFRIKIRKA
ncbi:hypothetical protein Val02_56430 [Virgisporangium aliadipatigenens]|uniref:Bacterial Death-like domain-containing protein n=1 Tax=Virgisporangium aliadipatigenens TaxID=741659 RepID=A0A8J3YQS4_9ACTN|nr:hypothetical protein [Virgisporangium aliadipatigenens]GIJ48757.1 hypothetical protein Val02_56430 [Virgisporangium aliadipatigenens]